MAVIHIGIELKDRDFAIALARGISRQGGDFQVHVENARECDVLLTDGSEAENVNFKGKSLFLTEKISSRTDKPNFIYKFEDSREIRRKILAIADTGYVSMSDPGSGKIKTSRNNHMGDKGNRFFRNFGGLRRYIVNRFNSRDRGSEFRRKSAVFQFAEPRHIRKLFPSSRRGEFSGNVFYASGEQNLRTGEIYKPGFTRSYNKRAFG